MCAELVRPGLKRKVTRRDILKIGAFLSGAGLSALILSPFQDRQNAGRVIRALQGEEVDCFQKNESELQKYQYDAIAVPGGGMTNTENGKNGPNEFQKLRLEAAAIAYINGIAPKIILLDGKTDPEIENDSSKYFLQNLVKTKSGGKIELNDDSVIIEHNSVNTASNFRELAKISKSHRLNKFLLITNFFHLQRAELNACAYDLNASAMAAEDIIIASEPSRSNEIQEFYNNQTMAPNLWKETLGIAEALFDPLGTIPILIKELFSPHSILFTSE